MVDEQRIKTMRERIGSRADNLVNEGARQYLPRVRSAQNQCTSEEWDMICEIAERSNNPQHYFMSIIAKDKFKGTLDYAKRLLARSVEAISYIAGKINNKTKSYINYVADKIAEGKYSMANVVNMVEIAEKKSAPDRYLIGILKKGYVPFKPKTT